MSHTSCLIELHYIPCIQYMRLFFEYEHVILEKHEHYQKGSYRNRCYIASAQGREMLSVPLLKGKNQQQPMQDVRIAYHTSWHAQHWHAIQTAYGKAPFFEHYSDAIRQILYGKHEKLWDLNMALLTFLIDAVHAPVLVEETTEYQQGSAAHFVNLRNTIMPDLNFRTPAYNQVFMDRLGFTSNLCGLDLLMNMGPEGYWLLATSG